MMKHLLKQPVNYLLIFIFLTTIAEIAHWNAAAIFVFSVLGIIPLAKWIGDVTEELANYTGPKLGAFLNATFGNAAELIITIVAMRAGLLDLVKASITGSIIGNLLLITGASILFGGLEHGTQRFDRATAGLAATQMTLAVIALAIPTLFAKIIGPEHLAVEKLSIGVAGVMMAIYILSLIYAFHSNENVQARQIGGEVANMNRRSILFPVSALALATVAIAWLSEVLVSVVEPATQALGLSEFFIGIIIIPIVGNAAEHIVAVTVARKNKMELSVGISLGSSMQIALFVAPVLVFISLFMGPEPLNLVFHPFELAALGAATLTAALIALDGESNWMEGAQLLGVFLIIAVAFFFLPV